jgi:hypothetical protein
LCCAEEFDFSRDNSSLALTKTELGFALLRILAKDLRTIGAPDFRVLFIIDPRGSNSALPLVHHSFGAEPGLRQRGRHRWKSWRRQLIYRVQAGTWPRGHFFQGRKNMKRFSWALSMAVVVTSVAHGDTVILNEDFESYADTTAMQTAWASTDPAVSRIADNSIDPAAFPGAGKGAEHLGGAVNILSGFNGGNALIPSATQSVRVEADIWENAATANKRVSLGFRGPGSNIIELGSWNANTCDPTVAGCVPGTTAVGGPGFIPANGRGLGARMQLFAGFTAPLTVQPNWQYFNLPTELDTSANGVVGVSEVGAGWNHYVATITPTSVTISIDLYRDGLRNTDNVPGTGTTGLDSETIWNVTSNAAGYTDIRFGGPSGVTSGGGSLTFDNIKVSLIDIVTPTIDADFNGNGVVDAADYVLWRKNSGLGTGANNAMGDSDNDGDVDANDYTNWAATFGNNVPGSGSALGVAQAVPEPATLLMLLAVTGMFAAVRRR